jgi:hypothetical protein
MNNTEIKKEEEISLLDLFTVLLRYWKLIVCVILGSVVLAGVGYFLFPLYQYKEALKDVKAHGTLKMEIASKAQAYVSQGLDGFILRPDIIYDLLHAAGMEKFSYSGGSIPLNDNNKTIIMYLINLFWIQNLDLNGNIYAEKDHNKTFIVRKAGTNTNTNTNANTSSIVEVTLKDKDPVLVQKFLESIYYSCIASVEDNLRGNARMMVNNYERIMGLPKISESMQMILERDFDTYIYLKDFLDGKEVAVKLISEPVFVETPVSLILFKNQYEKRGFLIVIAAGIFLAFLLAFVLNAVRNIKNDEESMKKINDALGNSGDK